MIVLGVLLAVAAGCNRAHYRRQADCDVYGLIHCGSTDPRWPLDNYTIEPDPRSRFFDPYSPDCPPMPPDDPTSHLLMQCVDGKRGWSYEHHYGATPYVENPAFERDLAAYLPSNEQGAIVLDQQAAVMAALIHSRSYQQELEDLYLSALDVSLERFQFDVQFFGENSTFFESDGPLHGDAASSSTLKNDTSLKAKKLCATGGQLTTEIANKVLWQFSGNDGHEVTTPFSFTFLQPLLRRAGRAVVLEDLTDSERALLANIRQMERFRRGFYIDTIAGRSPGPGPSTGAITLGSLTISRGGGIGGYLELLRQQLVIRNQRANVVALRDSLERLDAFLETGQTTRTVADQIRQSLYRSQIDLLVQGTTYEEQLDSYKLDVGLPPRLDVEIEDSLLDPFNLIDPALTDAQNNLAKVLNPVREGVAAAANALEAADAAAQAGQAAQATQVMLQAAEAAAEAIDASGEDDFARASQAASRAATLAQSAQASAEAALEAADAARAAVQTADAPEDLDRVQAEALLAATEAAGAEERAKAAKSAAVAATDAVAAVEAAAQVDPDSVADEHEQATAATAIATTKAAEAAIRAVVEVATQTARAAVKAAQATHIDRPVAAAELAAQTARAAGKSVDWAELGDFGKAAEAALEAADQATRTISAAIDRTNSDAYAQAAEATARAKDAVQAARQAMDAAEPSQYAGALEAAVAATVDAAEAALAATRPEDAAQAAAQAAARTALAAVEAALAAARAEETTRAAADAAKTATEPTDYADELTQSALAAVEAALAASRANEVAQAASQAARLAADGARTVVLQGEAPATLAEASQALVPQSERPAQADQQQSSILEAGESLVNRVRDDIQGLLNARENRCRQLEELAKRPDFQRGDVDPGVADIGAFNRRVVKRLVDFQGKRHTDVLQLVSQLLKTPADRKWFDGLRDVNGLANELPVTLEELTQLQQDAPQREQDAGDDLAGWHDLLRSFSDPLDRLAEQLADLSLVQARARLDTTTLTPVEIQWSEALGIARFSRRDWMNARAALVDRWRQIEIVANDLESDLDLTVEGDITPSSDTLTSVNNTTGNIKVGLAFKAPLTRLAERNAYRSVLIEYQRARRQYYAYEDQVSQSIRQTLRSIHLTPLEFELQRAAVRTAITQTERETDLLRTGRSKGPTAGRDIVGAFGSLLTAQNAFLRTWLEYEILRMGLDFDMGTMQLDDRGIWVDPGAVSGSGPIRSGESETIPLGPEVWPMPELMPPSGDQEPIRLPEVRDLPTAHRVDQPSRNVAYWLSRP